MIPKRLERHLTTGYISGLVFIALAACLATYVLHKALRSETEAARVFNIISAQQNRIQKIALLTVALTENSTVNAQRMLREKLLRTSNDLADDHELLISNRFVGTGRAEKTNGKRQREFDLTLYESLDRQIRTYIASARYLVAPSGQMTVVAKDDASVRLLLDRATSHLTAMLGKIHAQYRHDHERQIDRYKRTQFACLVGILLVLLLEAIFLFRPIVKSIKQEHIEIIRAKEAADQASRVKSEFLANVSHEIRTPLTAIIGFAEMLLLSKWLDAGDRELTTIIHKNAGHLKSLIDDLLDLAKVEANKMDIQANEVSIGELVREVVSVMLPKAKEKGLRLRVSYDTPLPAHILCDALRLKQVLFNLLSNALKFTQQGFIGLNVKYQEASGKMVFTVRDTGIGIDKEQQAELFKRFYQVDGSKTRRQGGSGIGLVLSRYICRALGGDLFLKASLPGKGTTFVATVAASVATPVGSATGKARAGELDGLGFAGHTAALSTEGDDTPEPWVDGKDDSEYGVEVSERFEARDQAGQLSAEALEGRLNDVCVLLVEDGQENQRIYQYFLQLAGAQVKIAGDGEVGVKAALRQDFDIVLMDIQMPKVDGYTATKLLKSHGYNKPIVALTAHAMKTEKEKCMAIGFSDYLAKPVSIPRLMAVVEKYCKKETLGMMAKNQTKVAVNGSSEARELHAKQAPFWVPEDEAQAAPIKSTYHGNELFESLLKDYGQALLTRVADLQAAVADANWKDASDIAHKMNGSAATYGYPTLSKHAYAVETLSRKAYQQQGLDLEAITSQLSAIARLCDRIVAGC